MIVGRRSLIVGAGAFLCTRAVRAAPFLVPAGNSLAFQVMRNGSELGKHILTFEPDGDNLTVHVAVDLVVKIGPIAFFRYTHRATEIWRNGLIVSVITTTNDDGKHCRMTATRTEAGLIVEGTKAARYTAPDDALPATHWNRKMLDGPMINTQYGDLMHPIVTPMGRDRVPVAAGPEIEADHFVLSGDASLDTWYDENQAWAALTFKASDKSVVRYERL